MNTESIWTEYRTALKHFLHSRVSNADDVDDLLQEVLIKTHNSLHSVKSEQSVKSWLFQIANRTIIDFYRKKPPESELAADGPWFSEEDDHVQQCLSQCIGQFVTALPGESAKLLSAIDLRGQPQKAYADEHGISYSTLKSRVQKARSQLRCLFEDCCHLSLDHRGAVMDFDPKEPLNKCK